jgi:hypothetical protein
MRILLFLLSVLSPSSPEIITSGSNYGEARTFVLTIRCLDLRGRAHDKRWERCLRE